MLADNCTPVNKWKYHFEKPEFRNVVGYVRDIVAVKLSCRLQEHQEPHNQSNRFEVTGAREQCVSFQGYAPNNVTEHYLLSQQGYSMALNRVCVTILRAQI